MTLKVGDILVFTQHVNDHLCVMFEYDCSYWFLNSTGEAIPMTIRDTEPTLKLCKASVLC